MCHIDTRWMKPHVLRMQGQTWQEELVLHGLFGDIQGPEGANPLVLGGCSNGFWAGKHTSPIHGTLHRATALAHQDSLLLMRMRSLQLCTLHLQMEGSQAAGWLVRCEGPSSQSLYLRQNVCTGICQCFQGAGVDSFPVRKCLC